MDTSIDGQLQSLSDLWYDIDDYASVRSIRQLILKPVIDQNTLLARISSLEKQAPELTLNIEELRSWQQGHHELSHANKIPSTIVDDAPLAQKQLIKKRISSRQNRQSETACQIHYALRDGKVTWLAIDVHHAISDATTSLMLAAFLLQPEDSPETMPQVSQDSRDYQREQPTALRPLSDCCIL